MRLIGFGHRKRSGKDTCGQYLVEKHGFKRIAFADPLKQAAMIIFGLTYQQCYGTDLDKETVDPRWGKSPRQLMQDLGESMRKIDENVWVKSAEAAIKAVQIDLRLPKGEIVISMKDGAFYRGVSITDCRHPNEAEMIRRNGGIVVRIDRPSLGPLTDTHASETSMETFEYDEVILNDGSIEDLYEKIEKVIAGYE